MYKNPQVKLNEILEDYKKSSGVGRVYRMVVLRRFLRDVSARDLLDAISFIADEESLNILLGAGLRGLLYYAVVKRKAEMMGV